ncbi:M20/M25/M40 family metallo-hydrolase [Corynebacterium sp. 4HC-13]|uniref:dipeptidase n=1 Tax=Corynebacterium anserum TaxID=2684406 RepID=UPI00163A08CC|nr:dipeptidase [Corynebacterium anserum]MBC2681311.1 M20/M25/M40 family metallo-hydrolase [Corynebacterium anserum]
MNEKEPPQLPSTTHEINGHVANALLNSQLDFLWEALKDLVAFQSVHSTPGLEEHNSGAAAWCVEHFTHAGIPVESIITSDGSEAIIGLKEPAEGYPTLLLYSHFDVQPAGDVDEWTSDPWTLTERDGRWYGRGAADCKGHVVMHLAVLRALRQLIDAGCSELDNLGIRIVVEGSEERGGYGLEDLLHERPELFQADTFLIADSGNDELGVPSICTALRGSAPITVTLKTIAQPMHSGQYGGAAPDALLELIKLLSTLHDEQGYVAVEGLNTAATWDGIGPSTETFAKNAGVLEGVKVIGANDDIAPNDLTVMRPSITITGLDSLSVADAINAVPGTASAVVSLRVPPGMDPQECQDLLIAHMEKNKPNAQMEIHREALAKPFSADTSGPALQRLASALSDVYGRETVEVASGGSIPLTNELLSAYPDAELALYGIEEPLCRIHSADESVHPEELSHIGAAELLFLVRTAQEHT